MFAWHCEIQPYDTAGTFVGRQHFGSGAAQYWTNCCGRFADRNMEYYSIPAVFVGVGMLRRGVYQSVRAIFNHPHFIKQKMRRR